MSPFSVMRLPQLTFSLCLALSLTACDESGSNSVSDALEPFTGLWRSSALYSYSPTYHHINNSGVITLYNSKSDASNNYLNCFDISEIARLEHQRDATFDYYTYASGSTRDVDLSINESGSEITLDFGNSEQIWTLIDNITTSELTACE